MLTDHPHISEAGVIGLPKSDGSEEVVAAIVLAEEVDARDFDHEGVRDWCRNEMTRYKVPRKFFIVEELPRDLIGKVRRREIKDLIDKK